jgi:hypothetical protein
LLNKKIKNIFVLAKEKKCHAIPNILFLRCPVSLRSRSGTDCGHVAPIVNKEKLSSDITKVPQRKCGTFCLSVVSK